MRVRKCVYGEEVGRVDNKRVHKLHVLVDCLLLTLGSGLQE